VGQSIILAVKISLWWIFFRKIKVSDIPTKIFSVEIPLWQKHKFYDSLTVLFCAK